VAVRRGKKIAARKRQIQDQKKTGSKKKNERERYLPIPKKKRNHPSKEER